MTTVTPDNGGGVRLTTPEGADDRAWLALRSALWPGESQAELASGMADALARGHYVRLAVSSRGSPVGFVEAAKRVDYVNGTGSSPVAFLEGLYVVPEARRRGIARALVESVAHWALRQGCRELASDSLLDNSAAHAAHRALGFEETERVVYFRRALVTGSHRAPSEVYDHLRTVLNAPLDRLPKARALAEALRQARAYHWVGLYDVTATQITAIAWTGELTPAYPSFPRSQGLNGAAVASGRALVVQDVTQDPRWLTTFGTSQAEAIFPVTLRDRVVGTIDVESDRVGAFTQVDEEFLAGAADVLRPLWEL